MDRSISADPIVAQLLAVLVVYIVVDAFCITTAPSRAEKKFGRRIASFNCSWERT